MRSRACSRSAPGVGLALTARRGDVPAAGVAGRRAGASAAAGGAATILLALLGALARRAAAQRHALRLPDPQSQGAEPRPRRRDRGGARREALAYAAGVILTCLALGGLLLALRAGGAAVGWAFQLQDPRVILLLLLLVTAISLNLAGLFRLPSLAGGDGLASSGGARGAFFTGALAAFVATPCTGPFIGFALGAALVLPTWAALAVFAGLGLGLALPFLLLGFVPALRRRLPRPGPWMERFQRILAVPMFLTALGLAWVLGRQSRRRRHGARPRRGAPARARPVVARPAPGRRAGRGCRSPSSSLAIVAPLPFVRTVEAPPARRRTASPPSRSARPGSPGSAPRARRSSSISPPTGASPARSTSAPR